MREIIQYKSSIEINVMSPQVIVLNTTIKVEIWKLIFVLF